jgi:hypothetical protein
VSSTIVLLQCLQKKDKNKKKKKRGDPDYDSDEDEDELDDAGSSGKAVAEAANGRDSAKPGSGPQSGDAESFLDDDQTGQGIGDDESHLDLDFELKPLLEPNETVEGLFDCQRVKVSFSPPWALLCGLVIVGLHVCSR